MPSYTYFHLKHTTYETARPVGQKPGPQKAVHDCSCDFMKQALIKAPPNQVWRMPRVLMAPVVMSSASSYLASIYLVNSGAHSLRSPVRSRSCPEVTLPSLWCSSRQLNSVANFSQSNDVLDICLGPVKLRNWHQNFLTRMEVFPLQLLPDWSSSSNQPAVSYQQALDLGDSPVSLILGDRNHITTWKSSQEALKAFQVYQLWRGRSPTSVRSS